MDFFEWWDSAPCRHANAACGLYGHSIIFGCTNCRTQATFSLHDDKTEFHVSISDGGKTRFNHVDMGDAARFAMRMNRVFMPEQGADPESRTFEKDRARLRENWSGYSTGTRISPAAANSYWWTAPGRRKNAQDAARPGSRRQGARRVGTWRLDAASCMPDCGSWLRFCRISSV